MAIGARVLVGPRRTLARQQERRYRIGWLRTAPDSFKELQALAFVQRLGELGLVEGGNLSIERREGGNRLERLPAMADELARLECDILFAGGAEALLAALKQADRATPIVFIAVDFDLLAVGHVSSLARPGGRITDLDANQSELPRKRLELMKELLPGARRVAVFTNDQTAGQLAITQHAAKQLGLSLHVVDFKRPPFNYEAGFTAAARANADAPVDAAAHRPCHRLAA